RTVAANPDDCHSDCPWLVAPGPRRGRSRTRDRRPNGNRDSRWPNHVDCPQPAGTANPGVTVRQIPTRREGIGIPRNRDALAVGDLGPRGPSTPFFGTWSLGFGAF